MHKSNGIRERGPRALAATRAACVCGWVVWWFAVCALAVALAASLSAVRACAAPNAPQPAPHATVVSSAHA